MPGSTEKQTIGLFKWFPDNLSRSIDPTGLNADFMGAAMTSMAYEGFRLLPCDYDEIPTAERVLPLKTGEQLFDAATFLIRHGSVEHIRTAQWRRLH